MFMLPFHILRNVDVFYWTLGVVVLFLNYWIVKDIMESVNVKQSL